MPNIDHSQENISGPSGILRRSCFWPGPWGVASGAFKNFKSAATPYGCVEITEGKEFLRGKFYEILWNISNTVFYDIFHYFSRYRKYIFSITYSYLSLSLSSFKNNIHTFDNNKYQKRKKQKIGKRISKKSSNATFFPKLFLFTKHLSKDLNILIKKKKKNYDYFIKCNTSISNNK